AEDHPVATFRSTRVEPLDERRAIVHGQLELRGVSREVALEVELNGARRHPMPPFRRTVGFSATATLARSDFGITAWRSMIGDTVQLRIEAEATRSRAAAGDPGAADDAQLPDAMAPEDTVEDADADADADAGAGADADAGQTPVPEPEPEP